VACHATVSPISNGEGRPRLDVADIFRRFGPAFRQSHHLTDAQRKVMWCIENCRTPALGAHRLVCLDCGHDSIDFNSCRNRHCPKCQALAQAKWVVQRQRRVLPLLHYHVVFTLPAQLRPIAAANRKAIFNLLFRSAADTLIELGHDPKWLGAQLGITAVLHTWTRELQFHPHLHCVVTAGGLATEGSTRWIHSAPDFLFPFQVLSSLFRGKFIDGLDKLYQEGSLFVHLGSNDSEVHEHFKRLKNQLYNTDWVVYCKKPFGGTNHVFKYLGRYTHRVAISNQRLNSIDDNGICFATKHGNSITLQPIEFIRRYLMHVLPDRFTKIRHYGLMASSNVNTRLETARALLNHNRPSDDDQHDIQDPSWQLLLLELTGIDLLSCPDCGSINIRRYRLPRGRSLLWDTS
jgi:hypothetical protein